MNKYNRKKNPLTKGQNRLLKESLKKLLGNGLINDTEKEEREEVERIFLKGALNSILIKK